MVLPAARRRKHAPNRRLARVVVGLAAVVAMAAAPTGAGPTASTPEAREPEAGGRIAVLPLSNRSGRSAPLPEVQHSIESKLEGRGFDVVDGRELEDFLRRHRVRYTGGLNPGLARLFRDEIGTSAVVLASVDRYDDSRFPEFGLTARLVSTGDEPRILWMGGEAEAGDGDPGFLDLGLITDPETVRERVTARMVGSIPAPDSTAPGAGPRSPSGNRKLKAARRFRPEVHYGSPGLAIASRAAGRVAVLPFSNESATRHAGEIVADQLIRHLIESGSEVIEPGVVRQVLLDARQIYQEGPSIPETDILRVELEADVVVFGEVHSYQDGLGPARPPVIGFSMRAIDTAARQVIWSSISHNRGSDGVFFFDAGRIATAHRLASEMTRALVATVRRAEPARARRR